MTTLHYLLATLLAINLIELALLAVLWRRTRPSNRPRPGELETRDDSLGIA